MRPYPEFWALVNEIFSELSSLDQLFGLGFERLFGGDWLRVANLTIVLTRGRSTVDLFLT